MNRGNDRQWNERAKHPGNRKGQNRADRDTDCAADRRQKQSLREIDCNDGAAIGPERLHRSNRVTAPVQVTLHGIAYSDAAHEKCSQAHDREELGKSVDVALKLW